MLRSPAPLQYEERNVFEALLTRQRHGSLGRYSPHTTGAALGSLVWGFQRHQLPLSGHEGCVNTLRWNGAGTKLVSGSDDCMLNLWDAKGSMLERLHTRHGFNIFDAHFKPDNEDVIASCSADGSICLTPVSKAGRATGGSRLVWSARSTMAMKLSFRPGQPEVMLSSLGDGSIRIFDLRLHRPLVASIPVVPHRAGSLVVTEFSPCGDLIAAGADDTVRILDFRQCSLSSDGSQRTSEPINAVRLSPMQRGTSGVSGVTWSRGGRLLLANFMGGDILMYDTTEAQKRLLHKPVSRHSGPAALPGVPVVPGIVESTSGQEARGSLGATEIAMKEGDFATVNAESSIRQRFPGRCNQKTFAKEVRFLFEDRFVVSGGDCGNLFIWRTSDGTLLQKMKADGSICNCVAPHPTLPLVAASGIDSTIKLFEVGGADRPPLVRRQPPTKRSKRFLNAVNAASSLNSNLPSPYRSWLLSFKRHLKERILRCRGICPCRRKQQQEADEEIAASA